MRGSHLITGTVAVAATLAASFIGVTLGQARPAQAAEAFAH